jgi:ribosomal protein L29
MSKGTSSRRVFVRSSHLLETTNLIVMRTSLFNLRTTLLNLRISLFNLRTSLFNLRTTLFNLRTSYCCWLLTLLSATCTVDTIDRLSSPDTDENPELYVI